MAHGRHHLRSICFRWKEFRRRPNFAPLKTQLIFKVLSCLFRDDDSECYDFHLTQLLHILMDQFFHVQCAFRRHLGWRFGYYTYQTLHEIWSEMRCTDYCNHLHPNLWAKVWSQCFQMFLAATTCDNCEALHLTFTYWSTPDLTLFFPWCSPAHPKRRSTNLAVTYH